RVRADPGADERLVTATSEAPFPVETQPRRGIPARRRAGPDRNLALDDFAGADRDVDERDRESVRRQDRRREDAGRQLGRGPSAVRARAAEDPGLPNGLRHALAEDLDR